MMTRSSNCAMVLAAAALLHSVGCGAPPRDPPGGLPPVACVDLDGDGRGELCTAGPDCDDEDAAVAADCATAAGQAGGSALAHGCREGSARECILHIDAGEGPPLCWWGEQRCIDGSWGDCVAVEEE